VLVLLEGLLGLGAQIPDHNGDRDQGRRHDTRRKDPQRSKSREHVWRWRGVLRENGAFEERILRCRRGGRVLLQPDSQHHHRLPMDEHVSEAQRTLAAIRTSLHTASHSAAVQPETPRPMRFEGFLFSIPQLRMDFIRHSEEVRIREDDQFWLTDVKELNAKVTEAQQGVVL
jgi:hypothetical protein